MNYSELVQAIYRITLRTMRRTFVVNNIPTFVRQTEELDTPHCADSRAAEKRDS